MSNSALATYARLSPNCTSGRTYKGVTYAIDTVTIHCFVGQVTAKRGCDYFYTEGLQASANYVVGYDGSIGLCVEEQNRSWCTGGSMEVNGISGSLNDYRAITIEVACDTTPPYAITDKAMSALLDLLTDICKRNPGIGRLRWKSDKSLVGNVAEQNMTAHRWFAAKACPGDYIYNRLGEIATEVNKRLKEEPAMTKEEVEDMIDSAKEPVYGVLKDVPSSYRPTIRKLMEKGALHGHAIGDPDDIEDNVLNVNETFCRIMTVLDRLGVLD